MISPHDVGLVDLKMIILNHKKWKSIQNDKNPGPVYDQDSRGGGVITSVQMELRPVLHLITGSANASLL